MSSSFHADDDLQQRAYDANLMRRLLQYVRPYRAWLILATVLLFAVALISNVTPLLIMWTIDNEISLPALASAGAAGTSDMTGLWRMTSIIALFILVEGALRYVQLLLVAFVGERTMLEMRLGLFKHLQKLPLQFLDRHPVGRLMSRVTNDVEKIQQTIVAGVVEVISDLLTIVVVLVFMLAVNWQLALIALSPVPLIFLTSYFFRKYARRSFLEIRRKIAALNAYMQEHVTGSRVVQLFGRQGRALEQYSTLNADHRDEWFVQIRNFAVYFPLVEFLGTLSFAFIILYCGLQFMHLGETVTGVASPGTFFGYVFWAERFFTPIRALADRYNLLLEAMASSERVFKLMDAPIELADRDDALDVGRVRGDVTFENVWFAYNDEQWVLKNLSVGFGAGERVAIVGHTGAGKSTFINLMARFYDVQRGRVLIDGVDVRDYKQDSLRRNIGVVLQDVFLFSGTIEENIRLGDAAMDLDYIIACAKHVNAHGFIDRLPGGYQFEVGERGARLSTGQRQLLAFARTLAHNPQILVLDEATSSVDAETELLIEDAINKLMAGRTSVAIAHRLSTVQRSDRILVMHHGELREQGTHQELLAQGGIYRTLYELQYKDQATA